MSEDGVGWGGNLHCHELLMSLHCYGFLISWRNIFGTLTPANEKDMSPVSHECVGPLLSSVVQGGEGKHFKATVISAASIPEVKVCPFIAHFRGFCLIVRGDL